MAGNLSIEKFINYNSDKFDEIKFYIKKIIFISQIIGGCLYFIYKKNNKKENKKKLKIQNHQILH